MTMTHAAGSEMPRYTSHKTVWALKIAAVEINEDMSAKIAPADKGYAAFVTKPGWAARFTGTEADLGYYVQYQDGFASWSPSKAFDEGYSAATRGSHDHSARRIRALEAEIAELRVTSRLQGALIGVAARVIAQAA